MDGTLIWMLILAGAIVALLGAFLAVSEKELRKKRQELAMSRHQAFPRPYGYGWYRF